MTHATRGRLEIVATPIGNLGDLTPRARDALAQAALIAAEDTRRTGQLLQAAGIASTARWIALHEHSERDRCAQIVRAVEQGARVALVSDAGSPLLSDPGYRVVGAVVAAGLDVTVLPGACAVVAALSLAGLPTDRFVFEGFLPARAAERERALLALGAETRTLVLFEAPQRIAALLQDLARVFGEQRPAAVARELTKMYESVYRGTLGELVARAAADPMLARGEITVVVGGAPVPAQGDVALLGRALPLLLADLPPGRAAAIAAQLAGTSRADAYALAQQLRPTRTDS